MISYAYGSFGKHLKIGRYPIKVSEVLQIAQVYGHFCSNLSVNVPKVQQQPNFFDCGVFAIAHAVEFCFNPTYSAKQNFDVASLRTHLTACIENEQFTTSPKEPSWLRNVKIDIKKHVKTIQFSCLCGLSDFVDDMVRCNYRRLLSVNRKTRSKCGVRGESRQFTDTHFEYSSPTELKTVQR